MERLGQGPRANLAKYFKDPDFHAREIVLGKMNIDEQELERIGP